MIFLSDLLPYSSSSVINNAENTFELFIANLQNPHTKQRPITSYFRVTGWGGWAVLAVLVMHELRARLNLDCQAGFTVFPNF